MDKNLEATHQLDQSKMVTAEMLDKQRADSARKLNELLKPLDGFTVEQAKSYLQWAMEEVEAKATVQISK